MIQQAGRSEWCWHSDAARRPQERVQRKQTHCGHSWQSYASEYRFGWSRVARCGRLRELGQQGQELRGQAVQAAVAV
jgi:hypothetical protein